MRFEHARVSTRILRVTHRLAPADAMGLRLFARQARPDGPSRGTVVLIHGATLASGLWDIAVPGYSMLEALAHALTAKFLHDPMAALRNSEVDDPAERAQIAALLARFYHPTER